MGRKSTITANPAIRAAVDAAIARGCTVDAIKAMLDEMGAEISRSAIGRHASKYADIAARQRDIRAAADAFASEFGNAEDNQSRLMIGQWAVSPGTGCAVEKLTKATGIHVAAVVFLLREFVEFKFRQPGTS